MDLVRRVDAAIQGRFATLTEQDIKARRFGLSRRMRPAKEELAHPLVFQPESEGDRDMLAQLGKSGWRGAVFALGDRGLQGPVSLAPVPWVRKADRKTIASLASKSREGNCAVQGQDGDVVLEARPVPASEKICLRCHGGVEKVGDPVGAVVYAFVRERAWVSSSGR